MKTKTPAPVVDLGDEDYTTPYPCGVCGQSFLSRNLLATHPHPKKKETRR